MNQLDLALWCSSNIYIEITNNKALLSTAPLQLPQRSNSHAYNQYLKKTSNHEFFICNCTDDCSLGFGGFLF